MFFREIETDRLFLKNISKNDREFMIEQFSNKEVNRYLFDAEPIIDMRGADEIIDFYIRPEPRAQHRWILVRKEDGTKIGTCGFHCWNIPEGRCEIGYDLYPAYCAKGYMLEALKAICSFAISDMKVRAIDACIYVDNERSIKLADKLGFVDTGKTRDEIFHGARYRHKMYTLDCAALSNMCLL